MCNHLLPQLLLIPHNGNDKPEQKHSCQVHILSDTKQDKNFLPHSELHNPTNLESFYCIPTEVTLSCNLTFTFGGNKFTYNVLHTTKTYYITLQVSESEWPIG